MSCIANFYLDGVKYSLEDYDMDRQSTQRLLQKVISAAQGKMEQGSSTAHASEPGDHPDHGEILSQLDILTGQQLNELDDEEMLKDL